MILPLALLHITLHKLAAAGAFTLTKFLIIFNQSGL